MYIAIARSESALIPAINEKASRTPPNKAPRIFDPREISALAVWLNVVAKINPENSTGKAVIVPPIKARVIGLSKVNLLKGMR
jgi:hypothetical protein